MGLSRTRSASVVEDQFHAYQSSLSADRRKLLERFSIVDMARKVVGVGSVGTRAWMVLLQGRDTDDPLFLQVKEATRSVLEDHLPKTRFNTPGQRVVEGQRMMQATSDIFLGWTKGVAGRPLLLLAPTPRHESLRRGRDHDPGRDDLLRPDSAAGHSPAPTPAPVIRSPSRPTSAPATTSTRRSPASPPGTPTRTTSDYEAFVQAAKDGRIDAVQGV